MIVQNRPANGGVQVAAVVLHGIGVDDLLIVVGGREIDHFSGVAETNGREQFDFTGFKREDHFVRAAEHAAFTLGAGLGLGHVIDAEDHVLRRHGKGQTVSRRQDIARAEHQDRCLNL